MAQSRLSILRGLAISLLLGATVATGSYAVFSKNAAAKETAIGLGVFTSLTAEGIRQARRRAKQSSHQADEQEVDPLDTFEQEGFARVHLPTCCVGTEENPVLEIPAGAETSLSGDLTSGTQNKLPGQDESSLCETQETESQVAIPLLDDYPQVEEALAQPASPQVRAIHVTSRKGKKGESIIVVQLPVMCRSQYRRETGIPQRLKALRSIKWQNTKMLKDGRRVMKGVIPASQSAENSFRQVVIITGSEIKST